MGKRTLLSSLEICRRLSGSGLNLLLAFFAPSPCMLPLVSAPPACCANHLSLLSSLSDPTSLVNAVHTAQVQSWNHCA